MRASRLSSSVIARVAYDEEERALSIWFRETGRYIYSDVPDGDLRGHLQGALGGPLLQ